MEVPKNTTSGVARILASHKSDIVECRGVQIVTPEGRCLLRDLDMRLRAKDKVAIVGRNGVGKTSLLNVLSGSLEPQQGTVRVSKLLHFVRQILITDRGLSKVLSGKTSDEVCQDIAALGLDKEVLRGNSSMSFGEARKAALVHAKHSSAELLLLDEPSQDLDECGVAWLVQWLCNWRGALLVVTHDPRILEVFHHFCYMAESGTRLVSGSSADVAKTVREEETRAERKYQRKMRSLSSDEFQSALIARRRRRKDRGGRMREIDRAPSRAMLNSKRSYAQESQGRRRKLQELRIGVAREDVRSIRKSLPVKMPLSQLVPKVGKTERCVVQLVAVGASVRGRCLFAEIDCTIVRSRVALVGPNGSGKTTLLEIIQGERSPDTGVAFADSKRIGTIDQGAANWMIEESLLERLERLPKVSDWQSRLREHRFPLALAMRAMSGLSPGERTRAALIVLIEQEKLDLLILDEPCSGLDTSARSEIATLLRSWKTGLIVASHDRDFLNRVGFEKEIRLSFSHLGKFGDFPALGILKM